MKKIDKILKEINEFCNCDCAVSETCAKEECILYRIQKIIRSKRYTE